VTLSQVRQTAKNCNAVFVPIPCAKTYKTRSTGTAHTSAEARLTSVAIWIWMWIRICIHIYIPDLDRHQNLIICSLGHRQTSLKISCKSVLKFLCKVANRQTDKQRRKHNLLGGGRNQFIFGRLIQKKRMFICDTV